MPSISWLKYQRPSVKRGVSTSTPKYLLFSVLTGNSVGWAFVFLVCLEEECRLSWLKCDQSYPRWLLAAQGFLRSTQWASGTKSIICGGLRCVLRPCTCAGVSELPELARLLILWTVRCQISRRNLLIRDCITHHWAGIRRSLSCCFSLLKKPCTPYVTLIWSWICEV